MPVHETLALRARCAQDELQVLRGELRDAVQKMPRPGQSVATEHVDAALGELDSAICAVDAAAGLIGGAAASGQLVAPVQDAELAARTYLVSAFDLADQAGLAIDALVGSVRQSRPPVDLRG